MGRIFLGHIGGTRLFSCASCDTILTNRSELISTRFTGATGRAFLFNKTVNLNYSDVQDRVMLTGRHIVRDVTCKNCEAKVGWMYEFATEENQRYKEGKVILERALITESEGFEETPTPVTRSQTHNINNHNNSIYVNSGDNNENTDSIRGAIATTTENSSNSGSIRRNTQAIVEPIPPPVITTVSGSTSTGTGGRLYIGGPVSALFRPSPLLTTLGRTGMLIPREIFNYYGISPFYDDFDESTTNRSVSSTNLTVNISDSNRIITGSGSNNFNITGRERDISSNNNTSSSRRGIATPLVIQNPRRCNPINQQNRYIRSPAIVSTTTTCSSARNHLSSAGSTRFNTADTTTRQLVQVTARTFSHPVSLFPPSATCNMFNPNDDNNADTSSGSGAINNSIIGNLNEPTTTILQNLPYPRIDYPSRLANINYNPNHHHRHIYLSHPRGPHIHAYHHSCHPIQPHHNISNHHHDTVHAHHCLHSHNHPYRPVHFQRSHIINSNTEEENIDPNSSEERNFEANIDCENDTVSNIENITFDIDERNVIDTGTDIARNDNSLDNSGESNIMVMDDLIDLGGDSSSNNEDK
ncbi:GATA zinc finger domain-containing protein 14-like isoform X2 [Gordionus sp. m RMFG-2023]|uniref:GATA zinc finger domain-containing protein 14-like isoform X2 n=1 Tax=Gordionus sp. m RMFG-2023 TaxID=3053472 RepID=UPI0031FD354D